MQAAFPTVAASGALLFGHCGIVHNRPTAYDLVCFFGTVSRLLKNPANDSHIDLS
jgi:hypothetical protein